MKRNCLATICLLAVSYPLHSVTAAEDFPAKDTPRVLNKAELDSVNAGNFTFTIRLDSLVVITVNASSPGSAGTPDVIPATTSAPSTLPFFLPSTTTTISTTPNGPIG